MNLATSPDSNVFWKKVSIPKGLPALLETLAKEAIRENPEDLVGFLSRLVDDLIAKREREEQGSEVGGGGGDSRKGSAGEKSRKSDEENPLLEKNETVKYTQSDEETAASKIQAGFRGYQTRKSLKSSQKKKGGDLSLTSLTPLLNSDANNDGDGSEGGKGDELQRKAEDEAIAAEIKTPLGTIREESLEGSQRNRTPDAIHMIKKDEEESKEVDTDAGRSVSEELSEIIEEAENVVEKSVKTESETDEVAETEIVPVIPKTSEESDETEKPAEEPAITANVTEALQSQGFSIEMDEGELNDASDSNATGEDEGTSIEIAEPEVETLIESNVPVSETLAESASVEVISAEEIQAALRLKDLSDSNPEAELEAKSPTGSNSDAELESKSPTGSNADAELEAKSPTGSSVDAEVEAKSPTGSSVDAEVEAKSPTGSSVDTEVEAKSPTGSSVDAEVEAKSPAGSSVDTEVKARSPTDGSNAEAVTEKVNDGIVSVSPDTGEQNDDSTVAVSDETKVDETKDLSKSPDNIEADDVPKSVTPVDDDNDAEKVEDEEIKDLSSEKESAEIQHSLEITAENKEDGEEISLKEEIEGENTLKPEENFDGDAIVIEASKSPELEERPISENTEPSKTPEVENVEPSEEPENKIPEASEGSEGKTVDTSESENTEISVEPINENAEPSEVPVTPDAETAEKPEETELPEKADTVIAPESLEISQSENPQPYDKPEEQNSESAEKTEDKTAVQTPEEENAEFEEKIEDKVTEPTGKSENENSEPTKESEILSPEPSKKLESEEVAAEVTPATDDNNEISSVEIESKEIEGEVLQDSKTAEEEPPTSESPSKEPEVPPQEKSPSPNPASPSPQPEPNIAEGSENNEKRSLSAKSKSILDDVNDISFIDEDNVETSDLPKNDLPDTTETPDISANKTIAIESPATTTLLPEPEQSSFANLDSSSVSSSSTTNTTVNTADFKKYESSSQETLSLTEKPVPKARKPTTSERVSSPVNEPVPEVTKRQRLDKEENAAIVEESKETVGELNSVETEEPAPVVKRRQKSSPKKAKAVASKYRSGFVMDDEVSMEEMEAQIENEMMTQAATKIQAGFRGYKTRKSFRHSGVSFTSDGESNKDTNKNTSSDNLQSPAAIAATGTDTATATKSLTRDELPTGASASATVAFQQAEQSTSKDLRTSNKPQLAYLRSRSFPGSVDDEFPVDIDETEGITEAELEYDPAYVNHAATKIQATVRGYLVRKEFKNNKPVDRNTRNTEDSEQIFEDIDINENGPYGELIINPADRDSVSPMSDVESVKAASKIQAAFRGYKDRQKVRQTKKAVVTIQATVRGFLTRRRLAKIRRKSLQRRRSSAKSMVSHEIQKVQKANDAATKIQAVYRGYQVRSKIRKNINDE